MSMDRLFEPVRIGPLTLRNRLVMTAMSTCFAGPRGEVNDRIAEYYAARAAGGTALITVEEAYIHPMLPHVKNALGAYGGHLVGGLAHLARRIHDGGALASLQLGLYFRQQLNGFPSYTVSADSPFREPGCKELNHEEIRYLTVLFADAAERTRAAGFDVVEIHACHGCLLSEFLSPYWNKRKDEYGGDRAGRFRFPLEILAEIRSRLGSEYPVIYRISGSEFVPEGFSAEDAVALSIALENAGVTAINVSGGLGHKNHIAIPPSDVQRGLLLPIAKSIREKVKVPVIVGNSMTPQIAAEAVEAGQADLIGLGRPLIADPEWPRKVAEGRIHELRQCIRCNQGCFGALRDPRRPFISCMYNPVAGREFESPITEAPVKKRVVVVGAGPAGCEAARVARLRGHEVIVLEKQDRVGGQFNLAALPPKKGDFGKLVEFYAGELPRLGVDVRLGTAATTELLKSLKADVYVLATGSTSSRPPIPGADLPHVFMVPEVLWGQAAIDPGPVVVVGGGASGLETADLIAGKGIEVTVIEVLDTAGRDIIGGIGVRESLMSRLSANGVTVLTGHRVVAIREDAVIASDRPLIGGGREVAIPARSVVLALGMRPVDDLSARQAECGGTWHVVGDSRNPGNAFNAIHQAFELAVGI
ncbi:FAD-dependent oxidoreductase [Syntrophobacter fumaroxidans]|uniref:NADH:flavin oxidoreductase/NADH oxidase n=1 Tax=Syntrophobacter fumaroxidans (strain DSM 10017 / MPOB) TaxID=335543 RepID=A0LN13_SYNFM|nr:FAD-dependent oxidoreductase [Syntrophobacter fumaroxidans]ABK18815.1 NADH:flavin oxidoreductase/NADH oxidase [Syntrophobacter fumaroxidans MPOB]